MVSLISRDAVDQVVIAVRKALTMCHDFDGVKIEFPFLAENDVSFAVLGALTTLCRDEFLIDDSVTLPREWPRCRAEREN